MTWDQDVVSLLGKVKGLGKFCTTAVRAVSAALSRLEQRVTDGSVTGNRSVPSHASLGAHNPARLSL